eukprot:scaffold123017_cov22-Tisochrysis_lutea.AAC.1
MHVGLVDREPVHAYVLQQLKGCTLGGMSADGSGAVVLIVPLCQPQCCTHAWTSCGTHVRTGAIQRRPALPLRTRARVAPLVLLP